MRKMTILFTPTIHTGLGLKAVLWFGKFCSCSCLPLLPGFVCSIHRPRVHLSAELCTCKERDRIAQQLMMASRAERPDDLTEQNSARVNANRVLNSSAGFSRKGSFHLIVAVIKVTSHLHPRSIKNEHDDRIFLGSTLVQTAVSVDSLLHAHASPL